ncbi:MAG: DUF2934 domain-containing protein [Candidatus Eisenbacteria bacterium]|nr:DUF2934 domain-containing protein [Candidatus Eisenbacteria bacterium]
MQSLHGNAESSTFASTPPREKPVRKAARVTKAAQPSPRKADHEAVAVRAYALFEASGRPPGRDQEFWLEAERQLLAELRV